METTVSRYFRMRHSLIRSHLHHYRLLSTMLILLNERYLWKASDLFSP